MALACRVKAIALAAGRTVSAPSASPRVVAGEEAWSVNAARLLGTEQELGTLESDKIADIMAVRDNPDGDMQAIESVFFVMKEGKVNQEDRGVLP